MIQIVLCPEPSVLATVRTAQLAALRSIVAGGRAPTSDEITGYNQPEVKRALWEAQHKKCCYCEREIEDTHEDVEHHRPKAKANRAPGSTLDHGYWWLAFTWGNLFYCCPQCNRPPHKGIRFPLEAGSTPLSHEDAPPGGEKPLLIDPALDDGLLHIQFVQQKRGGRPLWVPTPRNKSARGEWTIRTCGLDRDALLDRYNKHVTSNVMTIVNDVHAALRSRDPRNIHEVIWRSTRRLLDPRKPFVGLSYDVLQHFVPDADLAPWRQAWPMPLGVIPSASR